MTLSKEELESRRAFYYRYQDFYKGWLKEITVNLDKLIFVIATGTLVLTINNIEKISNGSATIGFSFLYAGLLSLVLAILFNLLTFIFSASDVAEILNKLNSWFNSLNDDSPDLTGDNEKTINWLNRISYFTLFIGILSLTIFFMMNIKSKLIMQDTPQGDTKTYPISDQPVYIPTPPTEPTPTPSEQSNTPSNTAEK